MTVEEAYALYLVANPFEYRDGSNEDYHMNQRRLAFTYGATFMYVVLLEVLGAETDEECAERLSELCTDLIRFHGESIDCKCAGCVAYRTKLDARKKGAN